VLRRLRADRAGHRSVLPDPVRLALGTLTTLPVPPPRRLDRAVAGQAMELAPAVGVLLGAVSAAVLGAVVWAGEHGPVLLGGAGPDPGARAGAVATLAVLCSLAVLAWSTRGLHLDGLADTADALGAKASGALTETRARRLAVMRAPDIGPFGVATLVLLLLVQTAALLVCTIAGHGPAVLVTAAAAGRLAITWACTPAVPAARPEGLGATVAGSVRRPAALTATVGVLLVAVVAGLLSAGVPEAGAGAGAAGVRLALVLCAAVLAGLVAGGLLVRRCVRAFGGITGDVLGATVAVTSTLVLVTAALLG
jgi:adenosylcobinamide-GDP ribazoletransferase